MHEVVTESPVSSSSVEGDEDELKRVRRALVEAKQAALVWQRRVTVLEGHKQDLAGEVADLRRQLAELAVERGL